ncbi:MAG: GTPase HflX [Vicinamibacterales bacterium]|nr:GTPase HflX [Vicinamibacterales bacterium]
MGLAPDKAHKHEAEQSLDELGGLVRAAGGRPSLRMIQERPRPDPATFLGRGKLQELVAACDEQRIDLAVFDHELTPTQLRHLEEALRLRVIDRTQLILDIFAKRARTREGQSQVELAQLQYLLPRLTGHGTELSRLGGGIGTRGPGETKLETDRRRIRRRIATIAAGIKDIRERRARLRERRQKSDVPTVALVGYTNAGKTTLFNLLTGEGAEASDALFVTLDPLLRKVKLPDRRELLVSDTVGFIDRLPHTLVAAFRGTLEEVRDADALLHVIDASAEDRDRRVAAVRTVLNDVGANEVPCIEVYNKADKLGAEERRRLAAASPDAAVISALRGQGRTALLERVVGTLGLGTSRVTLRCDPDSEAGRRGMTWVYRHGRVVRHVNRAGRAHIDADVPRREFAAFCKKMSDAPRTALSMRSA